MDNQVKQTNAKLNRLLETGKAMDAFESFYSEHVEMQENESEPRIGKAMNREQCAGFMMAYPDLELRVLSEACSDKTSFQEVLFSYTNEENQPVRYTEVAVRHWKDGQVIRERFYYDS